VSSWRDFNLGFGVALAGRLLTVGAGVADRRGSCCIRRELGETNAASAQVVDSVLMITSGESGASAFGAGNEVHKTRSTPNASSFLKAFAILGGYVRSSLRPYVLFQAATASLMIRDERLDSPAEISSSKPVKKVLSFCSKSCLLRTMFHNS
jgi:hypothetical protein